MKRLLLILLLNFSLADFIHAQDSLNCLVIEKYYHGKVSDQTKPIFIPVGEKIFIRTIQNEHPQTGILTGVDDSGFVIQNIGRIKIADLKEVGWYKARKNPGPAVFIVGGLMMAGGISIISAGIITANNDVGNGGIIMGGIYAFWGGALFLVGAVVTISGLVATNNGSLHKRQLSEVYRVRSGYQEIKVVPVKSQK